ncbi:hypothetical protein CDAR_231291 [Caerostris darwini]|uniref:Uncharacterized protein n=1 Tax=Caerostris darwini TaxID=1538125 RepID=A0AAV4WP51_9ARAC|nr:hypothetical protein CDAR_231291 [Caerostris darwini]
MQENFLLSPIYISPVRNTSSFLFLPSSTSSLPVFATAQLHRQRANYKIPPGKRKGQHTKEEISPGRDPACQKLRKTPLRPIGSDETGPALSFCRRMHRMARFI